MGLNTIINLFWYIFKQEKKTRGWHTFRSFFGKSTSYSTKTLLKVEYTTK